MTIENEFEIEQTVYIKTDRDQERHIIYGIIIRENGLMYELMNNKDSSLHYGFELSKEENVLLKVT